jgi:hypothetical protein
MQSCNECGSNQLSWFISVRGSLKPYEISCYFILGCDECSETIKVIDSNKISKWLNDTKIRTSLNDL